MLNKLVFFLLLPSIFHAQSSLNSSLAKLDSLAGLYLQKKDYALALKYNQKSLVIRQNIFGQRHSSIASSLQNFAELYYEQQDYTVALDFSIQSIVTNSPTIDSNIQLPSLIEQLTTHQYYSNKVILNSLKYIYKTLKTPFYQKKDSTALLQSYKLCKQAILLIGQQQNKRSINDDKLELARNSSFFVSELIQTALELAKTTKNPSYLVNSLYYMEHNKTLLLTDALKAQRAAQNFGNLPENLSLKELHLQQQKDQLQQQVLTGLDQKELQYLQTALNETNLQLEAFKKQLKKEFPKYFKLRYSPIFAKVSDLQSILTDDVAMLEYFIADSSIYLFYIAAKDFQIYPIAVNPDELKTKIKDLRLVLSDYMYISNNPEENHALYTQTALWFYQKLVAPALSNKKGIKHLVIIPDGELVHLPFEVFLTDASNATDYKKLPYLLKKYRISYDYSATLFKENLAATATKLSNNHLLGMASAYENTASPDFRPAHLQSLRKKLKPLPATIKEINSLAKQFNGVFAKGQKANERFFKEQAPQFGIIHLAMHGILNQHHPILSGLAFTENGDSIEDNFLQAYEISHLELNAALVVLSACETGYGRFQKGEGVMSLAHSFMYAGVPSLVVSLWQINDQTTALLMKNFYQNLLSSQNKATALQQAKLQYLEKAKGISAHPAFWSALVQLGNYHPIQPQKKTSYWWYISIALGLGIGYFSLRRRKYA